MNNVILVQRSWGVVGENSNWLPPTTVCTAQQGLKVRLAANLGCRSRQPDAFRPSGTGTGGDLGTWDTVFHRPTSGRNAEQAKSLPLNRRGGLVRHARVAHPQASTGVLLGVSAR